MLDLFKTSKKVVGLKQSIKALENDTVSKVFIASDADERLIKTIIELCKTKSITVENVENMKVLGKACSIQVGAAVVCLLK